MKTKILLSLVVLFACMTNAFAQTVNIGGIMYILNSTNNTAKVTEKGQYPGYTGNIIIPNTVTYSGKDYTVTGIGNQSFYICPDLVSVSIPNSVMSIGSEAFTSSNNLSSIIIPNSVISIESYAFSSCQSISSMSIPNGVQCVEEALFIFCEFFYSVTIPSSVQQIKNRVFRDCLNLASVKNLSLIPVDLSSSENVFAGIMYINECTLLVPSSSVTAYQNAPVWQELNVVGGGLLVNPSVNNKLWGYTDGNDLYSSGETATVKATARPSCTFLNWTKNGTVVSTNETYSFTVTEDIELVANFSQHTNTVSVIINNPNYGTVTGAGNYPLYATATLTANANAGHKFVNWIRDGEENTNNPYIFDVTENTEVYANFREKNNYIVNLSVTNSSYGSVVGEGEYEEDEQVTVTATAAIGYWFVNWSENGIEVSKNNSYSFEITEDKNLLATFVKDPWGIGEYGSDAVDVYPNPTSGELKIALGGPSIKNIEVYNIQGAKQNVQTTFAFGHAADITLDISYLSAGMYFVRITTAYGIVTKKILKQ